MTNKEIGEMIRLRRNNHGMTQAQLAKAAGVSESTIAMYEQGRRKPKDHIVEALADVFNVPKWAILYREDEVQPIGSMPSNLIPMSEMPMHSVPLIGSVAGGEPIIAEEDYSVYVSAPTEADYALTLQGDSMKPTFLDGDVLYIRKRETVRDGEVAVVLLDDSATLKRVYRMKNGLTLLPDNPEHKPIIATEEEYNVIRVLGVPVGFTRMFKANPLNKIQKGFH